MKHSSKLITGLTIATAMLSTGANATTHSAGLDACAQAVVSELGAHQNKALVYSLSPDTQVSGRRLNRRQTFHLDISKPGSDSVVARVDCVVDQGANVRKLIEVPIDGEDAVVRAKF